MGFAFDTGPPVRCSDLIAAHRISDDAPEERRRAAARLRALAEQPDTPDKPRAKMLADNHELLAKAIERRAKPH
jgi:hypothetical protein